MNEKSTEPIFLVFIFLVFIFMFYCISKNNFIGLALVPILIGPIGMQLHNRNRA